MLCSKCYKKIPEGEEVYKPIFVPNYWGNQGGIYCKKCVKILDKQIKRGQIFLLVFLSLILVALIILCVCLSKWIKRPLF